ncbi:hypothetical protein C7H83_08000 [Tetragenococcus halophilus]|uniref:Uncharacterized protein n=1 Tax=Tetragenococcus halophilus TaxID=51669 RepID=A0A3G5FJ71_TETHA|nr:hypothetical protein [Tetragenococcus halophilus]AYW50403.1 hypothetical protein C7H83_08000 [Tetragenococcus halophilus]GBD63586.1 putative uncharacterized protein [Tetragenococcus halophilus subsp. flandriensis]
MFFQHTLNPRELAFVIPHVNECLFAIHTKLTTRDYNIAVYKYGQEYFVLNDGRVFRQIQGTNQESQGDEEELLPYVEEAFEQNCYTIVEEKFIQLELGILSTMSSDSPVEVKYYEFVDFI